MSLDLEQDPFYYFSALGKLDWDNCHALNKNVMWSLNKLRKWQGRNWVVIADNENSSFSLDHVKTAERFAYFLEKFSSELNNHENLEIVLKANRNFIRINEPSSFPQVAKVQQTILDAYLKSNLPFEKLSGKALIGLLEWYAQ